MRIIHRLLDLLTLCRILLTHIEHGVVKSTTHQELKTEVVDALGIAVGLSLLSPVPVKNQAVAESQTCRRVGCMLITIENRASEGGLDMTHNLLLEAIFASKALRLVALPGFALRFGN